MTIKQLVLAALASLFAVGVNATIFTGPVADDAYVTFGGYDLAWASPCSDGQLERSCSAIDMTEQSAYGWQVMTSDLFSLLGISASTFLVDYSSANTQSYGGNNYAKATGWFSNTWTHIDVSDGINGYWSFADTVESSWYETITYRVSASVPEPSSVILFLLGLASLTYARRKNN